MFVDEMEFKPMDMEYSLMDKLDNNIVQLIVQIGSLSQKVEQLHEDLKDIKDTVKQHQKQLMALNNAITWTVKYGWAIASAIIFLFITFKHLH